MAHQQMEVQEWLQDQQSSFRKAARSTTPPALTCSSGVTQAPIKAGQLGSLAVTGVFDFNKAVGGGSAIPAGTLTYWDAAAQNATKNAAAGANKLIGKAVKATVDADTIVRVRLQQ